MNPGKRSWISAPLVPTASRIGPTARGIQAPAEPAPDQRTSRAGFLGVHAGGQR